MCARCFDRLGYTCYLFYGFHGTRSGDFNEVSSADLNVPYGYNGVHRMEFPVCRFIGLLNSCNAFDNIKCTYGIDIDLGCITDKP